MKAGPTGVRYDVNCSTEDPLSHGLTHFLKIFEGIEFKKYCKVDLV